MPLFSPHTTTLFSTCLLAGGLMLAGMADAATHKADFNGDGYGDLLVGVPFEDVNGHKNAGAVNVFYGSQQGLSLIPSHTLHLDTPKVGNQAAIIGIARRDDGFGQAVAVGDFDHDGYDDAAISIPYADYHGKRNAGAVTILYGSDTGLHGPRNEMFGLGRFENKVQDHATFGSALAVGDINGDSYADLAIGIKGYDVDGGNQGPIHNAGAIAIFFGSSKGLRQSLIDPHFIIQKLEAGNPDGNGDAYVRGRSELNDQMGMVLEFADFNTDGYADLAIGMPAEDIETTFGVRSENAGGVAVLHGSPNGLTGGQGFIKDQEIQGGDYFGSSLAAGDFNGDSFPDLAIGAAYEEVNGKDNAGAVTIIYGQRQGLNINHREFWHQDSPFVAGETESNDSFGYSLAAGDFNGDEKDDLAVGTPYEDTERFYVNAKYSTGFVATFIGTTGGLKPFMDFHQGKHGLIDTREDRDRFGRSLSVNDFDNDGKADLVIGVPGEDLAVVGRSVQESAGMLHILYGYQHTFLQPHKVRSSATQGGQAEAGDQFGGSLP